MSLSDKIEDAIYVRFQKDMISVEDVKEFIKELKDKIELTVFENEECLPRSEIRNIIDKLAGDKLI